jgi:hypothetical protein
MKRAFVPFFVPTPSYAEVTTDFRASPARTAVEPKRNQTIDSVDQQGRRCPN